MNDDQNLYREELLDLYRNPLNEGVLSGADVRGSEINPLCGDEVTVEIKFNTEGCVTDIRHRGIGCVISQVSASLVTDLLKGKAKAEIGALTPDTVTELLGLTLNPTRLRCALIALKAAQKAVLG